MRVSPSHQRARRPRWIAAGLALAGLGALAGCGGDDGPATAPNISATLLSAPPAALVSTSTSPTSPPAAGATTTDRTATPGSASGSTGPVRGSSAAAGASTSSTAAGSGSGSSSPARSTTTTVPPVSTGLPGGASDTALCRDYATVVGSQSVLTIAGAFGDLDTVGMARLELIASPSIVAAAEALPGEWPAELASEQALVAESVIGPIADRAAVARQAIDAAGIDEAVLVTAWQTALATYDPSEAAVTVTALAPSVEALLATAASTYAATSVRYDMDPSLLRGAPTPQTTTYLFDRCPELSYLIAGDGD